MRKIASLLMVLISIEAHAQSADFCGARVETAEGPVTGSLSADTESCSYLGIPYAAAPVGERRWKAPEPAARRDGVLEALHFGPDCPQLGSEVPLHLGGLQPDRSEDCLYLNVWRPAREGVFPVMAWIHGGALENGSGSRSMYWGDRLSGRKNVVVVTINYRLGALGFLAHPALGDSGNFGLLDQESALSWVRQNIAGFGGDPQNVTIFGESAGGWSVCNLLASPLAAGLFDKAIIQSGGCDATRSLTRGQEDGLTFGQLLGCEGDGADLCLRGKPVDEILKAQSRMEPKGLDNSFSLTWLAHNGTDVLPLPPIEALRQGAYHNVPLLVGSNRDEARMFALDYPGIRLAPEFLARGFFEKMLGEAGLYGLDHFYSMSHFRRPADQVIDAVGDVILGCPGHEATMASTRHQYHTYYYRFDYDDSLFPNLVGAAHGLEIPFIFDTLDRPPFNLLYTSWQAERARPLVKIMMSYWTNFAATGDPNGDGLPEWPVYEAAGRQRLHLDLPVFSIHTDNAEKCRYWSKENASLK